MTTQSQRRKTQTRQDFAQLESGDRTERSATAAAALLADLQAISARSAARLQSQIAMTEASLYNEDGLPA